MSHRCSKKKKKFKREHEEKRDNEAREYDSKVIWLLYDQISSLIMFFISDYFFYRYGEFLVYDVIAGAESKENLSLCASVNFIKANIMAVAAALMGVYINIRRYREQSRRKASGKIHYSIEPERKIATASIMLFFLFLLQLIGAVGIYKRSSLHSAYNKMELLRLYGIEIKAFQIRYVADYLFLQSTIMSIELIKSKYDKKSRSSDKLDNPDIPAIIAAELYVIQRSKLLYTIYNIYLGLFEEYDGNPILQPNILLVIGNIIGVLGTMITLNALIEIYKRNVNQPIFGR